MANDKQEYSITKITKQLQPVSSRRYRVAEEVQQKLAQIILSQLSDPRIGFITISSVVLNKDFSYADVYVCVLGKDTAEEAKTNIQALKHAAGYLRCELAKVTYLRKVPRLRFRFDERLVKSHQICELIDQVK